MGRHLHGDSHSPEHNVWAAMQARCYRKTHRAYASYGGRGIRICERWRGKGMFPNFLTDMGRRPSSDHQLERKDNDAGYDCGKCPECRARGVTKTNCTWATRTEQGRNKRNNVIVEFQGRSQPLSAWAEETGVEYMTLRQRIFALHWPLAKAFSTPGRKAG